MVVGWRAKMAVPIGVIEARSNGRKERPRPGEEGCRVARMKGGTRIMIRSVETKRYISIALLCGLLAGCGSATTTGGIEGVIFPASKAEFAGAASGWRGEYWTPSQMDVARAIPVIKTYLQEEAPSIASRLQQYRCQYFGIIAEGKKRMYCNFFQHGDWDKSWESEPVFVLDGGDLFFQLEYDVELRQCLNLMVNGEA